jgi:hypothetical protein
VGPNQCKNDPDGAVDADERLTLTDIVPGRYDVEVRDKKGRICVVRNVEVLPGKPYALSISEKDLTDCRSERATTKQGLRSWVRWIFYG